MACSSLQSNRTLVPQLMKAREWMHALVPSCPQSELFGPYNLHEYVRILVEMGVCVGPRTAQPQMLLSQ